MSNHDPYSDFLSSLFRNIGFVDRCRSCDISPLQRLWLLFPPTSLLQHPFPDVRRTVQD